MKISPIIGLGCIVFLLSGITVVNYARTQLLVLHQHEPQEEQRRYFELGRLSVCVCVRGRVRE